MTIKFYKTADPYGFLNNYSEYKFFIYGKWFRWVEAAYQSQKTLIKEEQDVIWSEKSPKRVRDLGQVCSMRSDWDEVKVSIMKECVMAKFLQHSDLRKQLMNTGDEELVEDSPVDAWWGCGKDGTGKNMLGKILMEVREELKGE